MHISEIKRVGKHTYGAEQIKLCSVKNGSDVYIGSFCSIGANLRIYCGGNHRTDWITTYPFGHINKKLWKSKGNGHPKTNGDIIIGNDVWIADNVTIMSGVIIGDGACIACNSHVVRDVKPYSIVGGNPAELIKYRFDIETIYELIKIDWWNWSDEKIKENIELLRSFDTETFINKCKKEF